MTETDPQNVRSADDASQTERPGDDDSAPDGSAPLTDWSVGQVFLDDYVVEQELGQGGMGKVYLLRSRSTGQPFAVKRAFLRNENSRRDFLAELQTWQNLSDRLPEHPHLVACRFFRTVGDEVVIFAEFVGGGSLADWIRDRRLTSLEQILDAAVQFAWGLHVAHEFGLVHQDVKPGNALMTGDGQVKVADFGLARDGGRRRFVVWGRNQMTGMIHVCKRRAVRRQEQDPADRRGGVSELVPQVLPADQAIRPHASVEEKTRKKRM